MTVTKIVNPKVPPEAGVPSSRPALSFKRFDAAHGRIGCRIQKGTVRCDLARRVWSAPRKPASCHAAWTPGLMVGPSAHKGYFVCARNSVLDPVAKYVPAGYDVKVGGVTCQVRSAGVTCFVRNGHGFFIGRTGYKIF